MTRFQTRKYNDAVGLRLDGSRKARIRPMDDEIYLSDLIAPVLAKWKTVAVVTLIGALAGVLFALLSPRLYESSATIYVQQTSPSAGLLAGLSAAGLTSGGSNPAAYYLTILDSNTLLSRTISRLGLLKDHRFTRGEDMTVQEAVKELRDHVDVKDNKNGRVDIKARWRSADLSAKIINTMLDLLDEMVFGSSKRKVVYLGGKLNETSAALRKAEDDLRRFQEKTGVPVIEEEAKRVLAQLSALDAQLLTLDVALEAAGSESANTGDLDALIQQEIRKRGMESSREYVLQRKEQLMSELNKLPSVAYEYVRLERNVAVLTKIYQILTERYQTAKIDEQGEGGGYQLIDRAEPADKPMPRGAAVKAIIGGFAAFLFACVVILAGSQSRRQRAVNA